MTAANTARRHLAWVPLGALLIGLALWCTALDEILSRPLFDWQLRLATPTAAATGVLVVDIDDASLNELRPVLGAWPYKRDVYALLVEQLRDAGAKAIAIDLLLADAQDGDLALARAIGRPGAPVVLAAAGLRHAQDKVTMPMPMPDRAGAGQGPAVLPALAWPAIALPAQSLWPAGDQLPRVGIITTPLDDDGRLRRMPLWHAWRDLRLPVLPLAVWLAINGPGAPADWPTDAKGQVTLALPASVAALPVLPLVNLARPALGLGGAAALAQAVQGRVIFIGSSALLADSVMTVNGQAESTAVLAHTYAALHNSRVLHPAAAWATPMLLMLALAPALLTWRRGHGSMRRDALAAVLAALAVVGAGLLLLAGLQMPTQWAAPLSVVGAGWALAEIARQRQQARVHRQVTHERALAAAANQAKSEFLAKVSHEIRTPLNALLGVAEMLAQTPLSPTQQRHVQVFRESGQTLLALISDLLDFSKIEAGRFELEAAPFSLHHMLQAVMALQRPRAEQHGLALALDLAADAPDGVRGDRKRLEQALGNLLSNAIKFTPKGQVTLGVAVVGDVASQRLRFAVRDSGIGIATSKLQSIFEPFTQADGGITRLYGGTGLGLTITRSVVQLMGGRIDVQSAPGQGSVFSFDLPLPPAPVPPAPAAAAAPAGSTKVAQPPSLENAPRPAATDQRSPCLLLAEDNEVNVYIFEGMLQDQGLTIDVAINGPMALDMARRRRYDLIFMDVQMPGMDGLSVTRELRRLEAAGDLIRVPIIALTANTQASDVQASVDAGCDMHLGKPFAKADLVHAIARFVPAGQRTAALPHTDN